MKYFFILLVVCSCSSKQETPTNDIDVTHQLIEEFERAMETGRQKIKAGSLDSAMYWSGYMDANLRARSLLLKNN